MLEDSLKKTRAEYERGIKQIDRILADLGGPPVEALAPAKRKYTRKRTAKAKLKTKIKPIHRKRKTKRSGWTDERRNRFIARKQERANKRNAPIAGPTADRLQYAEEIESSER